MNSIDRKESVFMGFGLAGQVGAGVLLREARMANGVTLAEVAEKTRVSRDFLIGLESGEIAEDIAPVYAIGYARAYARMVGVPEELAVDDVRAIVARRKPRRSTMVNPRKPPFLASRNAGWWAGTCIIAAAGAVLIALQFVPA
jgi:cytoskeleton protein RodZ